MVIKKLKPIKKEKINLQKRDYHRVLLTDVLPYEVPFILTNEGFYWACRKQKSKLISGNRILKNIFINDYSVQTNPLEFKIAKDADSERKLYLVHPKSQLDIVKLYKDYNQLISHLCNRSSYSLRYPSRIALAYYEKETITRPEEKYKDEGVGIDSDNEPIYASTFFEYKDFSFLYKFYDSYSFHRIEKKFNFLFKFDIAKCFASISTFQMSKSIRDFDSYNLSRGLYSFEHVFETIMNSNNNGNSHGIVVGPEFSRIFSEILLQSIDNNIKYTLENYVNESGVSQPILEGQHYNIKRYVDDFFLFYNNDNIRKIIYGVVISELEKYSLYCNESKTSLTSVPFITEVTIAKQKIRDLIANFFSCYVIDENLIKVIDRKFNFYYKDANKLITDIKCLAFGDNISYSSLTGYFFTLIRTNVSKMERELSCQSNSEEQLKRITNMLLIILDISFFVYSMDYRVRSTYLISQIVIIINKFCNFLGDNNSERIKKKIYDEAYLSIRSGHSKRSLRNIESLNLLISIRDIDIGYQLPIDDLEKIIGLNNSNVKPYYFNLMVGLFYIQNKQPYIKTRNSIVSCILSKFDSLTFNVYNNSELAHIFFDSIRCPYLTDNQKLNIAKKALKDKYSKQEVLHVVDIIKSQNWFIDWDTNSSIAIERLLLKKELKSPYGT